MQENERTKEQKNRWIITRGCVWASQTSQDEPWETLQSLTVTQAKRWPCTKFVKLCSLLKSRLLKKLSKIHSKLSLMFQVINCKPGSCNNGRVLKCQPWSSKLRADGPLLACFQKRRTVSTVSWKHPRRAIERRKSALGFVKSRESSDVPKQYM